MTDEFNYVPGSAGDYIAEEIARLAHGLLAHLIFDIGMFCGGRSSSRSPFASKGT